MCYARNDGGNTPLHLAAKRRRPSDLIEKLIANGANVTAKNYEGQMPIHYLAMFSKADGYDLKTLLPLLLSKNGTNYSVEARDNEGRTPLHIAASQGHSSSTRHLVKQWGADLEAKAHKLTFESDRETPHWAEMDLVVFETFNFCHSSKIV